MNQVVKTCMSRFTWMSNASRRHLSLMKAGDLKPLETVKLKAVGPQGDTVLFRHVNGQSVLLKAAVAIAMFPIWGVLGYTTFTLEDNLPNVQHESPAQTYSPEWLRQITRKFSKWMGAIYALFGLSIAAYWTGRTAHTVRLLVMKKGGNFVSFVTYTVPGMAPRVTTAPASHIRVVNPRFQTQERLLVKVKDRNLFKFRLILEEGVVSNRAMFNQVLRLPTNL